jgi:formylglycine-generating enzyme required for sulfatase activity
MARHVQVSALGLMALGVVACSLVVSLDGLGDGRAGVDAGAVGDAAATADAAPDGGIDATLDAATREAGCPGTAGPVMVDVGGYCIDATEVTRGQYDAFLKSNPNVAGQAAACSWNVSFLPSPFDLSKPDFPVTYVDWCDAFAYCAWAGKRLCGRIGGGPLPFGAASVDATQSQWYRACSKNGTQTYPYGNTYDPLACNGAEDGGAVAATGSFAGCAGGYPGIFDMAGNVEEWQDSCSADAGAADNCRDQAGTYGYVAPASNSTRCSFTDSDVRNATLPDVGFRCCAP